MPFPPSMVKTVRLGDDWLFWCPGCQTSHRLCKRWSFVNHDVTSPTFTPSLITDPDGKRCHVIIENGNLKYLDDCHHGLRNQTVPMESVYES